MHVPAAPSWTVEPRLRRPLVNPELCSLDRALSIADQHATPDSLRPAMHVHAIEKQLDLAKVSGNRPAVLYAERHNVGGGYFNGRPLVHAQSK